MSGRSPDDDTKDEIIDRLNRLRENAEKNNATDLLMKIEQLKNEVYALETY